MGIFSRISDVFKANVNDALDKAEDPEKMLKQMVIEMEESVNKTTLAVAQAVANEKNLQRKLERAKKEQADWEQKAMQALQANREDLAKAALEKKAVSQRNAQDLEPIYQQARTTADSLREKLNKLKAKLSEARSRQSTLIARSQAAKAQKEMNKSLSGVGSDAFGKFDKYENKIEQLESEAEAFGELTGSSETDLEEEFKQLSTSSSADSDLEALKAKMGMLESGSDSNK